MRLIDADALLGGLDENCGDLDLQYNSEYAKLVHYIDKQPTIDAEPVRHGRWIRIDDTFTKWQCSACGAIEDHSGWLYCHCGARMDGGSPQSIGFTTGGAEE